MRSGVSAATANARAVPPPVPPSETRSLVIALGILGLVLAHECGHAAAAQALGLRWRPFVRLPWKVGIAVWVNTPRQARLIGLAGPAANLACAAPLLVFSGPPRVLGFVSLFMATAPSAVDWTVVRASHRRRRARVSHLPPDDGSQWRV
jgi:hypothetical protein